MVFSAPRVKGELLLCRHSVPGRNGATTSGGSSAHAKIYSCRSCLRALMLHRYERLQAMYRRVNRRDGGTRGRAGVG